MLFLALFVLFLLLLIWLLPKLWRGIARLLRKIGQWLGLTDVMREEINPGPEEAAAFTEELQQVERMHREGSLTDEEFAQAKRRLLNS